MTSYKRIKGGEKTGKSGIKWSETELKQVLNLYLKLNGEKIHENNYEIQNLAKSLDRSVRSTEAQLLMFRNLEREGNYSHGNMNKISKEIWEQHVDSTENNETTYPQDLLKWAGHRSGGVKKPFRRSSGRPAGKRFQTPLSNRLLDWAKDYVNGEDVPSSILLVGGPGNGKTDTVEGLVEDIDDLLNLNGKLFEAFGRKYTGPNEDQSPPRRVTVDLKDLTNKLPENCRSQITIIQDATEKDSIAEPDKTAESLLINELNQIAHGNDEQVYICCVNRGILAQSYTEAQLDSKFKKTVELLTEITNSVTSGPLAGSCWPLDKYSSVIAWPMDMDTLVSEESGNKQKSVLHQIIDQITKHPSWKNCESGEMCPFCTNKKVLSESQNIDNLSSLLRAFELGTGKRWTFRDLYSLISFILVGSEEELVIGGTQFSPCEWTAKQLSLMESSRKSDDIERARSLYRIASCLYWHRLFPLWPRLATREFLESRKKLTGGIGNQAAAVEDLFKFLQWRGRDMKAESISRTITSKLCPLLDPANCKPDVTISYATTQNYTVKDLDESFSISVGQGLDLVKRRILPIENQILQRLAAADDRLSSEHISNQDKLKAERLQTTIRLFACRMVKRSIGTRNGVHCKLDSLTSYRAALDDSKILKNVQIRLRTLINDEQRNIFSVPMTTTFAQPAPPTKRNLILECQKVKVKGWKTQDTERPKAQIAYLNVDDAPVPLTFELYDALQNLDKGMHSGSLNDEVFAMIDRIRSKVAGRVVRDAEALDEDALLLLEGTGEVIRYSDEEFNISNIDEV